MRDAPWEHDQGEKPKGIGDCTAANRPAHEHDEHAARAPPAPLGARLLSKREVLAIVGVSYPALWSMMRAGTFPRSRVAGGKSVWLSSEIEDWLSQLPLRQLKGDREDEAATVVTP